MTRPFTEALVTAVADPPPPRARWRTPEPLQHLSRYLPFGSVDVLVVLEVLTAIAIFAGTNSMLISANARAGTPVADGELLLLAAAGAAVPLLLRDRWPLAAWRVAVPAMGFTVVVTREAHGTDLGDLAPYPPGLVLSYLLVLYAVGVRCEGRVAAGAWFVSVLGIWLLHPSPTVFLGAIMAAAALLYGHNVRTRRAAQRRVVEEEQRTEDERAARAVLEERSRIARELHDVLAHHISVIAIQAEAAPIKGREDPAVLAAELAAIRTGALAALTELRRVLGVLRDGEQPAQTAPQPDLAELDSLVASFRAAGLAVTVTTAGRPPAGRPGAGLAAYRVVQESLSNALRHAPGAAVRVEVEYRTERLALRITNGPATMPGTAFGGQPGQPGHRPRTGQGITGMRERVSAWNGTLTTGPTADGGFEVCAELPLTEPTPLERT